MPEKGGRAPEPLRRQKALYSSRCRQPGGGSSAGRVPIRWRRTPSPGKKAKSGGGDEGRGKGAGAEPGSSRCRRKSAATCRRGRAAQGCAAQGCAQPPPPLPAPFCLFQAHLPTDRVRLGRSRRVHPQKLGGVGIWGAGKRKGSSGRGGVGR